MRIQTSDLYMWLKNPRRRSIPNLRLLSDFVFTLAANKAFLMYNSVQCPSLPHPAWVLHSHAGCIAFLIFQELLSWLHLFSGDKTNWRSRETICSCALLPSPNPFQVLIRRWLSPFVNSFLILNPFAFLIPNSTWGRKTLLCDPYRQWGEWQILRLVDHFPFSLPSARSSGMPKEVWMGVITFPPPLTIHFVGLIPKNSDKIDPK